MKQKKREPTNLPSTKLTTLTVTIIIISISLFSVIFLRFTGFAVREYPEQVQFYFYDEITNCSLNGYIFVGQKLVGETEKGFFNLTLKNYEANFQNPNSNISVFGKLENCFKENPELLFDKSWKNQIIEKYYFKGESTFNFKTKINPNNPTKKDFIGFIQPNRVKLELNNINLKGKNTFEDLSKINLYLNNKINYTKDWTFNKENYWQVPPETLLKKQGDCEDFSTTLLSLFLSYNASLNCYNIIFSSHVTTLCFIDDYYIYYDQEKTELKKQIKTNSNPETIRIKLKNLNQEYFKYYGINDSETQAHYAFNDKEFIEFQDIKNKDTKNQNTNFINWQYSLKNLKTKTDIFEELDKDLENI